MSKFFNIQTDSDGVGTIFLYGDIGDYYDVQSGRVAKELMEAEKVNRRVNVRINSNGGEVYCGIAIYNALKNNPTIIEGMGGERENPLCCIRGYELILASEECEGTMGKNNHIIGECNRPCYVVE